LRHRPASSSRWCKIPAAPPPPAPAVPHQTGVRTFMWVYELLGVVYELVSLDFKPRISSHVFTFWSARFFLLFFLACNKKSSCLRCQGSLRGHAINCAGWICSCHRLKATVKAPVIAQGPLTLMANSYSCFANSARDERSRVL